MRTHQGIVLLIIQLSTCKWIRTHGWYRFIVIKALPQRLRHRQSELNKNAYKYHIRFTQISQIYKEPYVPDTLWIISTLGDLHQGHIWLLTCRPPEEEEGHLKNSTMAEDIVISCWLVRSLLSETEKNSLHEYLWSPARPWLWFLKWQAVPLPCSGSRAATVTTFPLRWVFKKHNVSQKHNDW